MSSFNSIADLHLERGCSVRASNLLASRGIDCAEKLTRLTEAEMESWKGCGKTTIAEINQYAERQEFLLAALHHA